MASGPADVRDADSAAPTPIWVPAPGAVSSSQLTAFIAHCERVTGRAIGTSGELYRLSVVEPQRFWALFLEWAGLLVEGDRLPVLAGGNVEHTRFFPGLRLSYAENLLACAASGDLDRIAVTSIGANGTRERLTRGELRRLVRGFAAALRSLGVAPGDHVVSVLRNDVGSVVAALGVAAAGASFSSAAPEMGVHNVLSRFAQLDPLVLVVSSIGQPQFEAGRLRELAAGLPTLRAIVVMDDSPLPTDLPVSVHRASGPAVDEGEWERYPFNHPLLVLFSSGTTGRPKCIVHGAGGTLLEHVKEHVLHGDLRAGEKLFFHTSTAWMMWNWQLSALACGAEILLYHGPVIEPETLWRIAAEERVSVFGTTPAYLRMCQRAGYSPRRRLDLRSLRSVMSTGAILYDDQYEWFAADVGAIPLQSISGGTEIVGCFVLGNPNLPVYAGEAQCRSFGLDVRAIGSDESGIGDLVCASPFPSRPLGFHDDPKGERFHAAYFEQHPDVWTHGDLITITERGTARIHGRSDGTMNVRGIRIGPAEVYRVLGSFAEIAEAMVVEQPTPGSAEDSRMVLLVVTAPGHTLDLPLRARIRTALARKASSAHVPAMIVDVPELPVTHSGKYSEVAATAVLRGREPANIGALRNPDCLRAIADRVAVHDVAAAQALAAGPSGDVEQEVSRIWEAVLGDAAGPDDDFFECGGTSLMTAPLFQLIADRLGRRLPLSTILHAPTISSLAALLRDNSDQGWGTLELLRAGNSQRPLFAAPGLFGDPLLLRPLAESIDDDRAVYGLRGRGLMGGELPLATVEEMAAAQIDGIRKLQPHGPYALLGYSLGGPVVVEIARRLLEEGEQVEFLGIVDTHSSWACLPAREVAAQALQVPMRWPRAFTADLRRTLQRGLQRIGVVSGATSDPHTARVQAAGQRALDAYCPRTYPGSIVYFRAAIPSLLQADATAVWRRAAAELLVETVPGHHDELVGLHAPDLARVVSTHLRARPAA